MPIDGNWIKKDLHARGWNDAMIDRFLGAPSHIHNFGHGRVAYLYNPIRVADAEATPEWTAMAQEYAARRQTALAAVKTRAQRTVARAVGAGVKLPELTPDTLLQYAISNYNSHQTDIRERHQDWDDWEPIEQGALPLWPAPHEFRDRICVNFLRHRATGYDQMRRWQLRGRTGQADTLRAWWESFTAAVETNYPFLTEEAKRQAIGRTLPGS